MTYQHGAYADIMGTKDFIAPKGIATLPVYFGTAPIHQLSNYDGLINKPILVSSYNEAKKLVGMSDDWENFTLCEAMDAHFANNIRPIGPIVLINVLDPASHCGTEKNATVTFTNNVGYINSKTAIISSISIAGKTAGTDYTAEYTSDGSRIKITGITSLGPSISVTYKETTTPTSDELVGGTSATGVKTGIAVLDLVYQNLNMVPTILCAPGWSDITTVNDALKVASNKINGHWYAYVNSDIECTASLTIGAAKTKKASEAYTSNTESPCWPMAMKGRKKYHISTLATVAMQQVDFENDNIPYETPSNKPIDITGLCLADGTVIEFDQVQANDLNSKGIRTASYWGGRWVLWGGHTGAYEYGKDVDVRDIFDSGMRMMQYLANDFQKMYGTTVDKPMNRAMVDTILNNYQEKLDNLLAQGKILFGQIEFNETSNPTSDMIEGDFVFDVATTTTPPGKSLTAKICYTKSGLEALFGGDE